MPPQWSEAIYAFGTAICTLHLYGEEKKAETKKLFAEVPKLRQRIAGKSIPLEVSLLVWVFDLCVDMSPPQKFAAKRAEKFQEQGGRLSLATLELTYLFGGIAHSQRDVVFNKMLPQTRAELSNLGAFQDKPEAGGNGKGYWDDYCLCRFLEGVCERYLAYPVRGGCVLRPGHFLTSLIGPGCCNRR